MKLSIPRTEWTNVHLSDDDIKKVVKEYLNRNIMRHCFINDEGVYVNEVLRHGSHSWYETLEEREPTELEKAAWLILTDEELDL